MRTLLITGISGAGKTSALRFLEDMGAFCVDNLPPMMVYDFMQTCAKGSARISLLALAVDIRSGEFFDARAVRKVIQEVQTFGMQIETIFFEASDDVVVTRYKETRRDHPLAGPNVSLLEAIAAEREVLQPLRETANYVLDTTTLRPRALQQLLLGIISQASETAQMRVEVLSFGFKRGIPREGDLVFDVRFLPNPFYIEDIRFTTGLEEGVATYVMDNAITREFMHKLLDMVRFLLPHYREEGKHRLVIGVGCTGGAHRSVAIAEALGAALRQDGLQVDVNHRDIELEKAHWRTL